MDEIDLLELGSYTELQGGNIMIPSGYSTVLGPMTKNLPPNKIFANHSVSKIIWGSSNSGQDDLGDESEDSDQTVIEDISKVSNPSMLEHPSDQADTTDKPKKRSNHIEVICDNGKKFTANHIICTIPLGVLKEKVDTLFEPKLPQFKLESIERLLFSAVDKIYLEYERPFLNPDITEVMLLWDNPSTSEDISQSWYKKIYSFSKVTETLLLGWVSGKEAEYMETLPMEEVGVVCTKILRKFLNDPFVPEPITCVW